MLTKWPSVPVVTRNIGTWISLRFEFLCFVLLLLCFSATLLCVASLCFAVFFLQCNVLRCFALFCFASLCFAYLRPGSGGTAHLSCAVLCFALLGFARVPGPGSEGNRPGHFPLPGPLKRHSRNPSRQSLVRE